MFLTSLLWFAGTLLVLVLIQKWVHQHLHGIAFLVTGRPDMALTLYALVLLPGVALHELAHAIMALLLGVRVGNFTIVPRRQPDGHVRLGAVQVELVDPIRSSLIGLAPLLAGSGAILLIIRYAFQVKLLEQAVTTSNLELLILSLGGMLKAPDAWLWLYLVFAIANAMAPSPADRETWPPVLLYMALAGALALALGWSSVIAGVGEVAGAGLRWLAAAFTITLLVDLPFVVLMVLIEITTGRVLGRHVEYSVKPQPPARPDASNRKKRH